jgi:diphthamide biosynthesis protein 2
LTKHKFVEKYAEAIEALKSMLRQAGKKFYTILVGKINPAKLANFAEVDVFVLVACKENSLVDSKEFFKPIITPFELEMALSSVQEWGSTYNLDIRNCGQYVEKAEDDADVEAVLLSSDGATESTDLRVNDSSALTAQMHSTGLVFNQRTWRGLEPQVGETPASVLKQGKQLSLGSAVRPKVLTG